MVGGAVFVSSGRSSCGGQGRGKKAGGWCGTLVTGRGDRIPSAGAERRSVAWDTRWVALCSCRTCRRERLPLRAWGMVFRHAPLALHALSGLACPQGSIVGPAAPGARSRRCPPSGRPSLYIGGTLVFPWFAAGRVTGFPVGCVEVLSWRRRPSVCCACPSRSPYLPPTTQPGTKTAWMTRAPGGATPF